MVNAPEADTLLDEPAELVSSVVSKSPRALVWERLRADRKTLVAAAIVVIYLVTAVAAPFLVRFGVLDPYTTNLHLLNEFQLPAGKWWGISWDHWLGVEPAVGRDVFARVVYAITFSMIIALSAAILAATIGVVLGVISGMSGKWVDGIIGRFIDLMLCFPQTVMLVALSSVVVTFLTVNVGMPRGDFTQATFVIIVMAIFGWMRTARLVRGQVLSVKEREFVEAARLMGASKPRLWFREVLPNLWAAILVDFTLMLPHFISTEAALSYLGVSVQQPTPTLGNLLRDSVKYAQSDLLYFVAPAVLIALIVVAFNLLGDGLRDALDPRNNR